MAKQLKTVGGDEPDNKPITVPEDSLVNPLLVAQINQAAEMRAALLTCTTRDLTSAKTALQNIAVLQIYHQVARIIRFIEQMDRLEDKLYDTMDMCIGGLDSADPATLMLLVKVQGDLYKTMVMSQELLKPYVDVDLEAIAPPRAVDAEASFGAVILPKESRNAIRTGAHALLTELRKTNPDLPQDDTTTSDTARTE